jgi:hypothetical protein
VRSNLQRCARPWPASNPCTLNCHFMDEELRV